jgi:acetyl esterase
MPDLADNACVEASPEESTMAMTTTAEYAFDVEDVEYLRHGDKPLLARLFRPKGAGPFPLMIDLHGGAWCNGDRLNDTPINEGLAKSGIMVAALDFRVPPEAGYPASPADINYAIRWFKSRAKSFNARGEKVGAIGISSGGHLGMLVGMRPDDPRYNAIKLADGGKADARIACMVLCWPVIDPLGRYRTAKEAKAKGGSYPEEFDRVLPLHDKYWGSEAAMEEGNPVMLLERGEKAELPPVLYLQGTADQVHPRPQLDRFVAAYRKAGGALDLEFYEGEIQGWINRKPGTPNAVAAMQRIVEFVHKTLA